MKFRFTILLVIFFSLSSFAQRQKPEDSPLYEEVVKMFGYGRDCPDSALLIARKLLSLADKDDDYIHIKANFIIGLTFNYRNVHDSAVFYYLEAMKFARRKRYVNSDRNLVYILYNCGNVLRANDYNRLAERFYRESLAIAKTTNDTIRRLKSTYNLSVTLGELNDFSKAIGVVNEAIKLSKESNIAFPELYMSLGEYHIKIGEFKKGIKILSQLVTDSINWNTKVALHAYYYLSKAYSKQGDSNLAEEVLKRAITMDPNTSFNGYFYCLYELGVLFKQRGGVKEAIDYFTKAENYVEDNPENQREFFEIFQQLSNLHRPTNMKLADTYHQKYLDALDKYTNNHRRYNLGKVVEDYYANIEQEEREANVRTYSIVISGSLLVLLGLTFSVSRYQRHRTKKKLEKESIDKR
ncbi:MAG: tetratricopeptide repeat protein, partial [Bacteroidota bacterium]